jgi:glycosyltransferase involved in cell wall biosynthesis
MNSGCAVVASHAIGSVPFLVAHEQNGLIYRDGDVEDAYCKVKLLLDHPEQREDMARHAYATIEREWNASVAVKKFLVIAEQLLHPKKLLPYADGVCSKAERLRDDWINKQ